MISSAGIPGEEYAVEGSEVGPLLVMLDLASRVSTGGARNEASGTFS